MAEKSSEDAVNLSKALEDALNIDAQRLKLSEDATSAQKELLKAVKEETTIRGKLGILEDTILELKIKYQQTQDESLKALIGELSATEKVMKNLYKKVELSDKIKENFLDAFGATEDIAEYFKKGGMMYAGAVAFKNSMDAISGAFSNTLGTAYEMHKTMGLNVKESAVLAGELGDAQLSMTGILYGGEAMAESAKALVNEFGNVNMATSDMIKGVTEINKLVGDASKSVQLALIFQNAGVAATEVNDMVEEIGSETGVAANKIMEEMAENQISMIGASKQELKLLQKHTAELIKQGVSRKGLLASAKGMLNVEETINSANKLRLLTGKQINVSALMAASTAYMTAEGQENQIAAEKKLNDLLTQEIDKMGGIKNMSHVSKEFLAQTLHMSEEDLEKKLLALDAQKNNNKLLEESNAATSFLGSIFSSGVTGAMSFGKELGKMIIQAMLFNKVMTGNFGFDKMFGGMGKSIGVVKGAFSKLINFINPFKGLPTLEFGGGMLGGMDGTAGGAASTVGGGLADTAGDKLKEKAGDDLKKKAGDTVSPDAVADNTSKAGKAGKKTGSFGKQIGDNLKGLAAGLTKMGTAKVLFGALNLIPTALGFVTIVPGIPGMMAVSTLGVGAGTGLVGLAEGLKKMGTAKVLFGSLNLIPAALGFVIIVPGIPGMIAVSALGVGAGAGLTALGLGLQSMGAAKTSIGALNLSLAAVGFTLMTAGVVGLNLVSKLGVGAGLGLVGLGEGLKKMGAAKTSIGALNLSLAAVGFTLMTAGAIGLGLVSKRGVGAGAGLTALGLGLQSMGAASTSIGALNLSLAAVGFTLMTAGAIGIAAIALGGAAAGAGLSALAAGLTALGASSVAGLIGIGLLALFGVALIPLTYALSLLAPLVESIGNTIATVIESIGTAIATVVGSIGELITKLVLIASPEVAGGVALFGLALIPLGLGLIALSAGLLFLTPVLPTLVALIGLGAGIALIANALGFGGGDSSESSETKSSDTKESDPLLEEIRGLRADIKAQPINVVLNNKIVGEINRASRASNSYVNK